jgi:hypothetical protein
MITQLDMTNLDAKHKKAGFRLDLDQFVDDVALLKPKAKFTVDNDCITTDYILNDKQQYDCIPRIYRVKVFEGGEQIGSLQTFEEYRQGKKVITYGVESFRIEKERGRSNTTSSMHKKVAIRNAKKFLVARAKDELADQIFNIVKDRLRQVEGNFENNVVWSTNQSNLARDYAIAAYHARISGSGTVTLQANSSDHVNNIKHSDEAVAKYLEAKKLHDMMQAKRGYGVQVYTDNSYAVLSLHTGEVTKYQHFEDIPTEISEKLGMFKVIGQNEPYAHLGVKLVEHVIYIVDGKTETKQ